MEGLPGEGAKGDPGLPLPPDRCPHPAKKGARSLSQNGPRQPLPGSQDPRVRYPHISAQLCRAFSKTRRKRPSWEETLPAAHFQPFQHICGDRPPFTPLFPLRNSSRPPARRPSPTTADRGEKKPKNRPRGHPELRDPSAPPGLVSFLRPLLTHQNAHLLLAEEAGEEGGDGEAHGGSGTCNGHEQKGFAASPGLLLLRAQKARRGKSC